MFDLFKTFFLIGLSTIGSSYAVIPVVEKRVFEDKKWVTKQELIELIAMAQTCPGVLALNISIIVGYKMKGVKGAIISSLATCLPSLLCILAIAFLYHLMQGNEWVEKFLRGVRPAVAALMATAVFRMAKNSKINRTNIWIPVLSALAIWMVGINPVYIILIAGICGYAYGQYLKE